LPTVDLTATRQEGALHTLDVVKSLRCLVIAAVVCTLASCASETSRSTSGSGRTRSEAATSSPGQTTSTSLPPVSDVSGASESNPPGDIPDNQAFVAFSPVDRLFTVSIPEGWARHDDAVATSFTQSYNTVRIERTAASTKPTVQSARDQELPRLRAADPGVSGGEVSSIQRAGGPALLLRYQADSAPNAVTGKSIRLDVERYEFWSAGTEVALVLSGAQGSDNVDPWRTITDSFHWQ